MRTCTWPLAIAQGAPLSRCLPCTRGASLISEGARVCRAFWGRRKAFAPGLCGLGHRRSNPGTQPRARCSPGGLQLALRAVHCHKTALREGSRGGTTLRWPATALALCPASGCVRAHIHNIMILHNSMLIIDYHFYIMVRATEHKCYSTPCKLQ